MWLSYVKDSLSAKERESKHRREYKFPVLLISGNVRVLPCDGDMRSTPIFMLSSSSPDVCVVRLHNGVTDVANQFGVCFNWVELLFNLHFVILFDENLELYRVIHSYE